MATPSLRPPPPPFAAHSLSFSLSSRVLVGGSAPAILLSWSSPPRRYRRPCLGGAPVLICSTVPAVLLFSFNFTHSVTVPLRLLFTTPPEALRIHATAPSSSTPLGVFYHRPRQCRLHLHRRRREYLCPRLLHRANVSALLVDLAAPPNLRSRVSPLASLAKRCTAAARVSTRVSLVTWRGSGILYPFVPSQCRECMCTSLATLLFPPPPYFLYFHPSLFLRPVFIPLSSSNPNTLCFLFLPLLLLPPSFSFFCSFSLSRILYQGWLL